MAQHPLRAFLEAQPDTTFTAACEALARRVSQRMPKAVSSSTIRLIADGHRRPRTPLSTLIAEATGIDELTLLKWDRPQPMPALESTAQASAAGSLTAAPAVADPAA